MAETDEYVTKNVFKREGETVVERNKEKIIETYTPIYNEDYNDEIIVHWKLKSGGLVTIPGLETLIEKTWAEGKGDTEAEAGGRKRRRKKKSKSKRKSKRKTKRRRKSKKRKQKTKRKRRRRKR